MDTMLTRIARNYNVQFSYRRKHLIYNEIQSPDSNGNSLEYSSVSSVHLLMKLLIYYAVTACRPERAISKLMIDIRSSACQPPQHKIDSAAGFSPLQVVGEGLTHETC